MTRVLVMQLFEALIHAVPSDQEDEQAEAIAAITAAREYLTTEPSGERAELIAKLRDAHGRRFDTSPSPYSQAAEMLEADAQQANKPTGWDNGLSQDYCAEFGKWLASRPGARQQIKAMFEAGDESEDLYTLALKADNWGQP